MKVAVGSNNPVKIKAVELAFRSVWPDEKWDILSVEVSSGVSNQPMSDEESIKGARNRAKRAIEESKADFGVGLEGGTQKIENNYFECGWIVVVDKDKREGIGSTLKVAVPKKAMEMINQGMELGHIDDILFDRNNSKQTEGHFGLMTNNAVTRAQGYRDGVVSALSRFLHPELF